MRALPLEVFRNPLFEGCSLGGISERYDKVLVVCPEGHVEVDPDDPPENLVRVVQKRGPFGAHTPHLEPVAEPSEGCAPWMPGGTVAGSGDSRWGDLLKTETDLAHGVPLEIFDRSETWDMFRSLSH